MYKNEQGYIQNIKHIIENGVDIPSRSGDCRAVFGVGINDVSYKVHAKVDGVRVKCPYYSDWYGMMVRCYNSKYHLKKPTYIGASVCEEWHRLSNFITWVDSQPNKNWRRCELDKDLLKFGNKVYSPESCVYISREVNTFIGYSKARLQNVPLGVSIARHSPKKMYLSQCQNPFSKQGEYLGVYYTAMEAHLAWKERKHHYACLLADTQEDIRVANRLRTMYSPETDWINI